MKRYIFSYHFNKKGGNEIQISFLNEDIINYMIFLFYIHCLPIRIPKFSINSARQEKCLDCGFR